MSNSFFSKNPYDQSILEEYPTLDTKQVAKQLRNAEKAYDKWKRVPMARKEVLLQNVATILRKNKEDYARLITLEMGKPLSEARGEVEKCAANCDYYATNTRKILKPQVIKSEATYKSMVTFDPIGAVFAIMPWNFPFWQVFRFAGYTTLSGNVILLKHAPNVCGCAKACEQIFREAGYPEGVFQSLIMDVDKVEQVISSNLVQGVMITGSEQAGSAVGALSGKHIKKSILELGGSDALIVLEDADMTRAAKNALASRMLNAGQACNNAKRFIVTEKAKPDFVNALLIEIKRFKQGNPLDSDTLIGPLARLDLADKLEMQLAQSTQKGASILYGGVRDGAKFMPTLVDNVKEGMLLYEEEAFGPLASLLTVKDEKQAVKVANSHRYGLDAAIWTADVEKGYRLGRQLEAGSVFVNSMVKSDSRFPFGGVKKSGYGRELSEYGVKEFLNIKTMWMDI
ncbi:MAG: hypothetical protein RLZZ292_483 [Bacteroidota bacterium]|jgi:succinate-semialdehyde dehydrogenase/glutarate-semialdehyde dehydrogenase